MKELDLTPWCLGMVTLEGCAIAVVREDGYLPSDEHKSSKTNVRVKQLHLPNSASALQTNFSILSVHLPVQTHPREFDS